jgi:hypothetical protein
MKLYTEEQLLNSMNSVRYYINHYNENVIDKIIDNHIKALSAIELPSDDEINKESFIVNPLKLQNDYSKEYYDDNIQYREEWLNGAKWVINYIKQQDDINVPLSKQQDNESNNNRN